MYVGVRATDPHPAKIVGHLTRRDTASPSDWIRVVIDSFHDRRTAYEFAVNPVGVKQDKYYFNDGDEDDGWDAVWDVAAIGDRDRVAGGVPHSRSRSCGSRRRTTAASASPSSARCSTSTRSAPGRSSRRAAPGFVSQFGRISNIRPGRAPRRLEIQPYVVADLTTNPSTAVNTFVDRRDPSAALGLDLKYALSPGPDADRAPSTPTSGRSRPTRRW